MHPVGLFALLGGVVAAAVFARRRSKRMSEALDRKPAFDFPLDIDAIRNEPDVWREKLDGKVARVCCVPYTKMSSGRYGGGTTLLYQSFVLDTNGEAHDVELGSSFGHIEENAKWLATLLGVPHETEI